METEKRSDSLPIPASTPAEYYAHQKERYKALTTYVSSVNERLVPLKKKLGEAQKKAELARLEAQKISEEISAIRGGSAWFVIKKEIGQLARLLGGL